MIWLLYEHVYMCGDACQTKAKCKKWRERKKNIHVDNEIIDLNQACRLFAWISVLLLPFFFSLELLLLTDE